LERLLPKSIQAITARGFEHKVALFVLATPSTSHGSNLVLLKNPACYRIF
jgi:hypothetical protein